MWDLPASVETLPGEFTVWADYAAANETGVPLYLINNTGKPKELDVQDGDPFIKLFYQADDGSWQRAQAHLDSWCGNSYYTMELPPHSYFTFTGYQPSNDGRRPSKVRYQCLKLKDLVSNIGDGFALKADILASALDRHSSWELPSELLAQLYPFASDVVVSQDSMTKRTDAVRALTYFPVSKLGLRRLEALEASAKMQRESSEMHALLAAIREVRAGTLPRASVRERVTVAAKSLGIPSDAERSLPESMAYEILRLCFSESNTEVGLGDALSTEAWKTIAAKAADYVSRRGTSGDAEPEPQAIDAAHFVLRRLSTIPQLVEDRQLETWLRPEYAPLTALAADALSDRRQFEVLATAALKIPEDLQVIVLPYLVVPSWNGLDRKGQIRKPESEAEERFWQMCVNEFPEKAAASLAGISGDEPAREIDPRFHDALARAMSAEAIARSFDHEITPPAQRSVGLVHWESRLTIKCFLSCSNIAAMRKRVHCSQRSQWMVPHPFLQKKWSGFFLYALKPLKF